MPMRFPFLCLALVAWLSVVGAATSPPAPKTDRLQWFEAARTGLFIHWGPYSITGCEWQGQTGNRDAHLMNEFRIPLADYRRLAGTFSPQQFDAAQWVGLAKEAGLRYLVYVSKHHDGFAMFDSPSSAYDITDATPFGRDPLKEIAAECRKQGLTLCLYYSLGRDWSVPGVPTGGNRCNDWDFPQPPATAVQDYIDTKVKPQLRELLTQYGPIGSIWFDTPDRIAKPQSEALRAWILSLQPNCLINARIGHGFGDYAINEQKIPASALHSPWETCLTINDRWAYDKTNHNWKSPEMIVRCLVDVASKGGNFLINVGPTGEGVIPQPSVDRLRSLGDWLKVNGESIYGTTASRFSAAASGIVFQEINPDGSEQLANGAGAANAHEVALPRGWRSTSKPGCVYLHLFDRPAHGVVRLQGFSDTVRKVTLLADPQRRPLDFQQNNGAFSVTLPAGIWDSRATVLKLEIVSPQ